MNYPDGYYVRTETGSSRRVLMEDAKVYRSVPNGHAEVLESEVRSVAGFPKGTAQAEIREIARLDSRSRDWSVSPVEREEALHALAERFGREARRAV